MPAGPDGGGVSPFDALGAEPPATPAVEERALPVFTSVAPDPRLVVDTGAIPRVTTLDLMAAPTDDVSLPVEEVCAACANARVASARFCPFCGTNYPSTTANDPFAGAPEAPEGVGPTKATPTAWWIDPTAAAAQTTPSAPPTPAVGDPFSSTPDAPAGVAAGKVTPTMVMRLDPAEQKRLLARLLAESGLTVDQIAPGKGE